MNKFVMVRYLLTDMLGCAIITSEMEMRHLKSLLAISFAASFFLSSHSALGGLICSNCEYQDAPTYLGLHNPDLFDTSSFAHTDLATDITPGADFADYWVFDINPDGGMELSSSFGSGSAITNFRANVWTDNGLTACIAGPLPTTCVIDPGTIIASASTSGNELLINFSSLLAGRYIVEILGTTSASAPSAYSGSVSTGTGQIPIPSSISLIILGLLGIGIKQRHREQ